MAALVPFHLSLHVNDLAAARRFYVGTLGCEPGRSTERWIDVAFFGHQLSLHLPPAGSRPQAPQNTGEVDGTPVPMPHFGVVLDIDAFAALEGRLRAAGTEFVLQPQVRYPGAAAEQRTMFVCDPSGNALEFKALVDPKQLHRA